MGRTIVTTCGTSLLSSGCWSLAGIESLVGLKDDDRIVCEGINKGVIVEQMKNNLSGETMAQAFKKSDWETLTCLQNLPAELASLRVYVEVLKQTSSITLGSGDKIVLLYSTNEEGKYCAKVLEIVLKQLFSEVIISCDPIEHLDPVDFNKFGDALTTIWGNYGKTINTEHNAANRIIFNLTGGYKAIVMVLAALCAANPAIPVSIIYLHESAPPNNLFVMNFQGTTILERLQTGYCDVTQSSRRGIIGI